MVRHIYTASNLIDGLNKPLGICDWPYQNQSKSHINFGTSRITNLKY